LMSHPGPGWHIRGGQNFRSRELSPASPHKAMQEWLGLCDAITRAGGHILVLPPAPAAPAGSSADAELTGMIYTANAGQLFHTGDEWLFLVSRMAVAHRQGEAEHVRRFVEQAGVRCRVAGEVWEGQADVQTLGGNRFITTWGVRSSQKSLAEVRALLPAGAHVLEVKTQEPFFHGDTCLNALTNRAGDTVLLAFGGALASESELPAIRTFVGARAEVIAIERDDALGYACNALCVNGTLLLPRGLSTGLRGQLRRRGFDEVELDLGELFGKGGGGPRCLVNELRGLVVNPGAPDYRSLRDGLSAAAERYPTAIPTGP